MSTDSAVGANPDFLSIIGSKLFWFLDLGGTGSGYITKGLGLLGSWITDFSHNLFLSAKI